MLEFNTLIIGSGLAGLTLALKLADHQKIGLITKKSLKDGASGWAQGGIAAVLSGDDTQEAHTQDTLLAGAGLCDETATRHVVKQGRQAIDWLITQGVPFTKDSSNDTGYHLTREGGHDKRRIIHAADATGLAIQETLIAKILKHPNITVLEGYMSVDLITGKKRGLLDNRCYGVYALNTQTDEVITIAAQHTILATGGSGKVYLYTTNPDTSTGDGIAMAWRAGCRVANMEFIQFHPTCLYHPHAKSFLISEAVRGEGGILKLADGTRFMPHHDPRAELAPRDIVARAIDYEMKKGGLDCVYLDISHQSVEFLQEHFPNIFARCLKLGINISQEAIPVVPAAHYTCGGIVADLKARTDVKNLYAVGETAYSGLHGANRLASNSLLECLVFADSAAKDILSIPLEKNPPLAKWDDSQVTDADEHIVIAHNWAELRHFMWDYVGIVRTNKRLQRAQHRVQLLQNEIDEYYSHFHISADLLELRNLVTNADLIVQSALARHESRGLHYSLDYPQMLASPQPTILHPT